MRQYDSPILFCSDSASSRVSVLSTRVRAGRAYCNTRLEFPSYARAQLGLYDVRDHIAFSRSCSEFVVTRG